MKNITVLLVDDHTVVRQGLRALLSSEPDIQIVGEAENGWQALRLTKETHPEVVLMDLAMPSLNGLDASKQILREVPGTKILILTSYNNDEYVKQMTQLGVSGYLLKQTAAQELVKAIHEIQAGNAFFSPDIARRLRDQSRSAFGRRDQGRKSGELTTREVQVLDLVSRGFSNKQMAAELGISIKTVEKHRQQLMNKLNIHDVAGLTRYALSKQLGPASPEAGPVPPGSKNEPSLKRS